MMKKFLTPILFLIIFIGFNINSYAQVYVNGIDINKMIDVQYISVRTAYQIGNQRFKGYVNYGQKSKIFEKNETIIDINTGEAMQFHSSIEILNWLYAEGWELFEIENEYSGGENSSTTIIYYMKRRK